MKKPMSSIIVFILLISMSGCGSEKQVTVQPTQVKESREPSYKIANYYNSLPDEVKKSEEEKLNSLLEIYK